MKTLLIVALSFTFCPFALSWTGASRCNVGNSSGCSLLPVDDFNACFTCDSGTAVEAGSCALQHPPEAAVMCRDVRPKCEAEGGVFTWCYGDSCNGCSPRYRTLPLDAWVDKSVVFVTAHPDDLEALAGATVAALVNQGSAVNIIIITNGDKGCSAAFCQNYTSDQIAVTRRAEAVAAAAALGVQSSNLHFLGYEDGGLAAADYNEVLRDVVQRLRLSRADVVISFYPYAQTQLLPSQGWADLGYHPDHMAAGKYALDAAFFQGNRFMFQNASAPPHTRSEFYFFNLWAPTHVLQFDKAAMDAKTDAFLKHASQYSDSSAVSKILQFIGSSTPHYAQQQIYAEGFQLFS